MAAQTDVRITVLAATRMHNGVCVAGINRKGLWVRPVPKDGLNFSSTYFSRQAKGIVDPYNEVQFQFRRKLDNHPQTEDVEVEVATAPRLVRTLNDLEVSNILKPADESKMLASRGDNLAGLLESQNRSLILTKVDKIVSAYRNEFGGKRQRRISFIVGSKTMDFPCTDLRWRALTRGDHDQEGLSQLASAKELYFAIGLSRPFNGKCWPMVIGVHPIPRLAVDVDYDNL